MWMDGRVRPPARGWPVSSTPPSSPRLASVAAATARHRARTVTCMSRVAAIDCGTNSIRLLVADVSTNGDGTHWLRDVHREQRVVRLGQGVDSTGVLAPDALARTRTALLDYTKVLRRKGTER